MVDAPLELRPDEAMTAAYVQSLQQGLPSQQQQQWSLLGDSSNPMAASKPAAAPQPLYQGNTPDPNQQIQNKPLVGAPIPAATPYQPNVTLPKALNQIPVDTLMQSGQLPVNPQVIQATARIVQALRQPKVSPAAVTGPPIA